MAGLEGQFIVESDQITPYLKQIQDAYSPSEISDLLLGASRAVSLFTVLKYPDQSRLPLPRIYAWTTDSELHKFKSPKHQRGFFAALNAGRIQVPRRRTGTLARSPRYSFEIDGTVLLATLHVPEFPYSFVFRATGAQSNYFRTQTKWQPLVFHTQQNLEELSTVLVTYFDRELAKKVDK